MMSQESLLSLLFRVNTNPTQRRELFEGLDAFAKIIQKTPFTVANYKSFLGAIHDVIVHSESAVKSELLRIVRYGFATPAHGDEIIAEVCFFTIRNDDNEMMMCTNCLSVVCSRRRLIICLFVCLLFTSCCLTVLHFFFARSCRRCTGW